MGSSRHKNYFSAPGVNSKSENEDINNKNTKYRPNVPKKNDICVERAVQRNEIVLLFGSVPSMKKATCLHFCVDLFLS